MSIVPQDRVAEKDIWKMAWRIRIKVLRKWYHQSKESDRTLEMVFCDEEGSKIHATIPNNLIAKFDDMFFEMQWRIVYIFKVINAVGVSDIVYNNHKIEFIRETIVSPTNYVNDKFFFSFADYEEIPKKYGLKNYLIDLIGVVMDFGEITEVDSFEHGSGYKKLKFQIENERKQRLSCVAWGEKAEEISNIFSTLDADMINVCVLRFWKFDIHGGAEVHTVGARSQTMINPDIEEIDHF